MKKASIFWLVSMVTCAVLYLPISVSARPAMPMNPTITFCDGNLTNLISTMNNLIITGALNVGWWEHGTSPIYGGNYGLYDGSHCWDYSGGLDNSQTYFTMATNPLSDITVPAQAEWSPYKYGIAQTFSHPANQVVNIGFITLSSLTQLQQNAYQICYAITDGGLPNNCTNGTLTGSRNIRVTLPISGLDTLNISGKWLGIQYVTLGTNSATPTATPTNTPAPTNTPGPSHTCGYVLDCWFQGGSIGSNPAGVNRTGGYQSFVQTSSPNGHWQFSSFSTGHATCGTSNSNSQFKVAIITDTVGSTDCHLAQILAMPSTLGSNGVTVNWSIWYYDTNGHMSVATGLCLWDNNNGCIAGNLFGATTGSGTIVPHDGFWHQYSGSFTYPAVGTYLQGFDWGFADASSADTMYVFEPCIYIGSLPSDCTDTPPSIPLVVNTPTPTPTATNTPANTATSTPVSFDGSPLPSATNTYLPGTPTPTTIPTVIGPWCNGAWSCDTGSSTPNSSCNALTLNTQPPANLLSGPISKIPVLSDILQAAANVVVGFWQIVTDLFIPQHINCDFTPLTNSVLTKVAIPDISTITAPLQTAVTTPCGYIGVQNIGFNRPNIHTVVSGPNHSYAPTVQVSQPISIGVDGCAAPWITYYPLGRGFIDFAMWVWFSASTLLFIKSFFTGKSFGGP